MFTGIVEEVGRIVEALPSRLSVVGELVMQELTPGDSIAVNGICLTVVKRDATTFSLDVVPETLRRTNLGHLRQGDPVNLERAVVYGARVGGHLVQGHGEGTGAVRARHPEGTAVLMELSAPARLMPYLVEKGFVAVDGVSLTVVAVGKVSFTVSLIPFTLEHTVLGSRKVGDMVNLETDIIAKYVERLTQGQRGP